VLVIFAGSIAVLTLLTLKCRRVMNMAIDCVMMSMLVMRRGVYTEVAV